MPRLTPWSSIVVGSRRDDTLQGSDDSVYLNGGLGHGTLTGGKGDDILQGGPQDDWGNNRLYGGDGFDTALYMQDYATSEISFRNGEVVVGNDTMHGIEQIVFGDGTHLDTDSHETSQGEGASAPSVADIFDNESAVSEEMASTTPSEPTDTQADVSVTGNITSDCSGGYVAEILVENTSGSDIIDPELHFELPAVIETLWNGAFNEDADSYRVTDDSSST